MVSETLYRGCAYSPDIRGGEYSPDIRAAVHVRYGVHSFRGSRMENGLLADILAWEPNRERGYVSPASTDTYDRYEACAMRTGKPLHCPRSFCSVSRLRFTAVRSGIDAAPTNDLLDTLAFTGPETQELSVLRPVTSAFRTAFDSYCIRLRTWGVVYSGRPR